MAFDTQTIMMVFFIFLVTISFYKIRQFLPQEQLPDDDKTKEATETLESIVLKYTAEGIEKVELNTLFEKIKNDEAFDAKHFWRFNQNRLLHLLTDLELRGLL